MFRLDTTLDPVNQEDVVLGFATWDGIYGSQILSSNNCVIIPGTRTSICTDTVKFQSSQTPGLSKRKRHEEVQVSSDAVTVLSFTASHDRHESTLFVVWFVTFQLWQQFATLFLTAEETGGINQSGN